MGNKTIESNPFHWKHILENLSFSENYKVSLPKLKKIQFDGQHSLEIVVYVDDLRIIGDSQEIAWEARSKVVRVSVDWVFRMRRKKSQRVSQCPGAWAGGMIASNRNRVTKSVIQEILEKMRNKIWCLVNQIRIGDQFTSDMFEDVLPKAERAPKKNIDYKTVYKFNVYESNSTFKRNLLDT